MMKQQDKTSVIVAAQKGDLEAFDQIVFEYQDMAAAYSYSILSNVQVAEDAAQEAFIEAFQTLSSLQNPLAFAAWFRCIIFKHCHRHLRRKLVPAVSLDMALEVPDEQSGPGQLIERAEFSAEVHSIIALLTERERAVTLLYYMGQQTYQEIADFLDVPLTTVKKRLYSARQKLRTKMAELAHDLQEQSPSRDEEFAIRIRTMAQRVTTKYQPSVANGAPASSNWSEALASRIRLQSEGAQTTLEVAGSKASLSYGEQQDCLSVCGNFAHIARHNQILLLDMAVATSQDVNLPSILFHERPRTLKDAWEFLLNRESDSPEQAVFRLKTVNDQIAGFAEKLSEGELSLPVETLLYDQQTVRDLLLIILQQGSFASGQAWGILKLQAYKLLS
jgi:RNA polymerase sigma factor (sigma-70 family)